MINYSKLRLSELIMFSTVQLRYTYDGYNYTGTASIINLVRNRKDEYPILVTNRHVAENAHNLEFILHAGDKKRNPISGKTHICSLNYSPNELWMYHPDIDVDLAIMPFGELLNTLLRDGKRAYYTGIDVSCIPSDTEWRSYHTVEDILVVGYPNGIIDSENNLPIFLKGNTATHPNIDYDGKKEFLVNANAYPGSSGSPIFLLDENFISKSRIYAKKYKKIKLLGILYGGYEYTLEPKLVKKNIHDMYRKANVRNRFSYNLPTNICTCIKSTRLQELITNLNSVISRRESNS